MLHPGRAFNLAVSAEALPELPDLAALHGYGVRPRKGQLMMVAGRPGAMKSTLAMWWAAKLNLPTLYFSADMAPHTASTRLAAVLSGDPVEDVSSSITGAFRGYYEEFLSSCRLQFCFDSSPTVDDIALEVDAYVEVWDEWPQLIVVDNAMNVDHGLGESYQGLLSVMDELHRLARVTGAAVWILHHTTESTTTEAHLTQPSRDIQGKITQLPEVVLTVAYDQDRGIFRIAPVKHRNGKSDPTGRTSFDLVALPERASFRSPALYY